MQPPKRGLTSELSLSMVSQNYEDISEHEGDARASNSRTQRVSRLLHEGTRLLTRAFGANYGRLPGGSLGGFEELSVDLGEIRLKALHWAGGGIPIVLLHGLNNSAWAWVRAASLLTSLGRPIYAVSLRGHGGSSAPRGGYSLGETTQDVIGFMDQLGIDKADFGGHSWGGKISCYLACTRPARVCSLMLADPVPAKGLNGLLGRMPFLIDMGLKAERGPFADVQAWESGGRSLLYLQAWDDLDKAVWSSAFNRHADGTYHHCLPDSGYREILDRAIAQDITPLLSALRCPVLLMRPTLTVSFMPWELRQFRASIRCLEELRIRGDHTFMHTNPMDSSAAMMRFLRRNYEGS